MYQLFFLETKIVYRFASANVPSARKANSGSALRLHEEFSFLLDFWSLVSAGPFELGSNSSAVLPLTDVWDWAHTSVTQRILPLELALGRCHTLTRTTHVDSRGLSRTLDILRRMARREGPVHKMEDWVASMGRAYRQAWN